MSFVEGNPKPRGVALYFVMQGQGKPNQIGFQHDFHISDIKEFSSGVVEVNGNIPTTVGSGTYQFLRMDVAAAEPAWLAAKEYDYSADFKDIIKFDVVNDASVNFPKIKSITPEPPK